MAGILNTDILERAQVKIEAVRGVAETAMTRWLYQPLQGLQRTYQQDLEEVEEVTRTFATVVDRRLGIRYVRFNLTLNLTYEEAIWWLNCALDGSNLSGVTTGSTPPGYTYTLTPNTTADDLATFTMKAGDTTNIYKYSRCVVNKATFRWNPQQGGDITWKVTLEIFAIWGDTTTYDAPADITRNRIFSRGTKLYIDEPGGTIGTTQITATLRQGEFTIDNQIEEKVWSESTTDPYTDFARGSQIITGSLVFEYNANAETEFAKMRAGTTRKLRLLQTGDTIGATPTTNYKWQVDFPTALWMAPTEGYAGHNKIITFPFVGQWTSAVPQPISIVDVIAAATVTA